MRLTHYRLPGEQAKSKRSPSRRGSPDAPDAILIIKRRLCVTKKFISVRTSSEARAQFAVRTGFWRRIRCSSKASDDQSELHAHYEVGQQRRMVIRDKKLTLGARRNNQPAKWFCFLCFRQTSIQYEHNNKRRKIFDFFVCLQTKNRTGEGLLNASSSKVFFVAPVPCASLVSRLALRCSLWKMSTAQKHFAQRTLEQHGATGKHREMPLTCECHWMRN